MKRTAQFIEEAKSNKSLSSGKAPRKKPGIGRGQNPNSKNALKVTQFKPGVSGNPGGKPKFDFAGELARAVFEKNPELVLEAFNKQLKKGNAYAFSVLADRGYGKVKEVIEHTGTIDHTLDDVRAKIAELLDRRKRA